MGRLVITKLDSLLLFKILRLKNLQLVDLLGFFRESELNSVSLFLNVQNLFLLHVLIMRQLHEIDLFSSVKLVLFNLFFNNVCEGFAHLWVDLDHLYENIRQKSESIKHIFHRPLQIFVLRFFKSCQHKKSNTALSPLF